MAWTKKAVDEKPTGPTKALSKMPWGDFAKALGIEYDFDRMEGMISDQAFEEANQWIQEYEKDNNVELGEDLKDQIRFLIEEGISNHWSLANVLEKNLNLDGLVDSVNEWSQRGQQMAIYEDRELPAGKGIVSYDSDYEGITFTIAEPFIIAYIEAVYCVMSIGDEGMTLEDMGPESVPRVIKWIAECEGWSVDLDLDRWDERRNYPRYTDLVKLVEASPGEVKQKEEPVTEEVSP